ncbi:MAG: hypothetical protein JSV80_16730 [Acidobacteriota bacterium]|nr:MAG: hypothetical protein JSV80_16730 [Acidobacteriota bacterium]
MEDELATPEDLRMIGEIVEHQLAGRPDDEKLLRTKARVYERLDELEQARAAYLALLECDPDVDARLNLIGLNAQLGHWEELLELVVQQRADGDYPHLELLSIRALVNLGRHDKIHERILKLPAYP